MRHLQAYGKKHERGLKLSTKLLQSTFVVGGMTLLSRVFGLLRDITLATLFGASGGTDAFLVAFKIPNFMRRLFAEGAFSQAFVPVFSEYKEKRSPEELKDLINHVAGKLGGILLLITIIGSIAAPGLVLLFASGFLFDNPDRYDLTVEMLRVTFPYLFFISLVAFAGGILNSFNKFAVPAITPVLLNLCLIGAAIWWAPLFDEPLMALAWGVALAGVVQFMFQLPALKKLNLIPRPKIGHHEGVSKILKLMLPAVFGSSVAQINLLLDTIIASYLAVGSITWLYYSDRLLEFPLGVLGIAVATVILPALSKQHARESSEQFNQTLNWASRLVLIISLPACAGLFVLAGPVLSTLFQYGAFSASDTYMASLSLMAYIFGLPAFILIKIYAPGYFARQDTRTPVRIGIIAMVSNMVMNMVFVVPLYMYGYEAPHVGLALATSCSAYLNAFLLYRGLRKAEVFRPNEGWSKLLLQITFGVTCMVGILIYITPELLHWTDWSLLTRITWLTGIISLAVFVYFFALMLVGLKPGQLKKT